MKRYITWDDVERGVRMLDDSRKGWVPDAIVALTHGGVILGTMFRHALGLPLLYLQVTFRNGNTFDAERWDSILSTYKKILVVDDIYDTGRTIQALHTYNVQNREFPSDVRYGVLFFNKNSPEPRPLLKNALSYAYPHGNKDGSADWLVFPWECAIKGRSVLDA